jgi:hypothetical protein
MWGPSLAKHCASQLSFSASQRSLYLQNSSRPAQYLDTGLYKWTCQRCIQYLRHLAAVIQTDWQGRLQRSVSHKNSSRHKNEGSSHVGHTWTPGTLEGEAWGSWVWGHPKLQWNPVSKKRWERGRGDLKHQRKQFSSSSRAPTVGPLWVFSGMLWTLSSEPKNFVQVKVPVLHASDMGVGVKGNTAHSASLYSWKTPKKRSSENCTWGLETQLKWQYTCLASSRPWVQASSTAKKKKSTTKKKITLGY